ncbi:MAG TPA: hypothetical protein VGA37_03505 [Gemmatimonadales bacterium]
MRFRGYWLAGLGMAICAASAHAQATGTPSFNAPYRAFARYEFGGTLSLPSGPADVAVEGQFRFGQGKWDIGVRGGIVRTDAGAGSSNSWIAGVEGRQRILEHSASFPLDAAVVIGAGTSEFDAWTFPGTVTFGRRVDVEDFSFIAYGQPGIFITTGTGDTDVSFGIGFGADFRVGNALDLRVSVGILDGPEGLAVSLVWVR